MFAATILIFIEQINYGCVYSARPHNRLNKDNHFSMDKKENIRNGQNVYPNLKFAVGVIPKSLPCKPIARPALNSIYRLLS